MNPATNPATNPTAVFYRRTLIDLDKARVQLRAIGATPEVITALGHYQTAVKTALHTQGAPR